MFLVVTISVLVGPAELMKIFSAHFYYFVLTIRIESVHIL
jgi:hypothetical protein